jgi:outer membrane protein TolC
LTARGSRRRLTLAGACLAGALLIASLDVSAQRANQASPGLTLEEALTTAMRDNPNVLMTARQLEAQRGALVAAGDPFDVKTQTSFLSNRINNLTADPHGNPFWLASDQTQYSVGAQKQLRNGVLMSSEMGVSKSAITQLPLPATGQASATLNVLVPLLRDHGGVETSAPERVADRTYGAGVLDAQHVTAQAVYATAVAYWDYLAAIKRLAVVVESESRAARLAADTERLVEAGERTTADLTQVRGNVAAKRVNRISAEQAVVDARVRLGLQMGIPPTETAALLPAVTEFPTVDEVAPVATATRALVDEALTRRPDLQATAKQVDAANLMLMAARDAIKPRVDLISSVGYVGLQLGTGVSPLVLPIFHSVPGPNASVQIRFQWAAANFGARGRLLESASNYDQERLAETELRRQISTSVFQASEAIARATSGMKASREAVELYQATVRSEQRKFQLGVSTLFDTIQAADGLTNVMLSEIAAAREYAVAVATLRFQTGSLVTADRANVSIDVGRLVNPR